MKRPAVLRNAIEKLWSKDREERLAGLKALNDMTTDMVDIRSAQPALASCLASGDGEVRIAALSICEFRSAMGYDVGVVVPTLLPWQRDPDPEISRLSRRVVHDANLRLKGLLDGVVEVEPHKASRQ